MNIAGSIIRLWMFASLWNFLDLLTENLVLNKFAKMFFFYLFI